MVKRVILLGIIANIEVYMKSIAYLGFSRETEVEEIISNKDIETGYVKVTCFECEGSKIFEYPSGEVDICVCCKGVGKVYINC